MGVQDSVVRWFARRKLKELLKSLQKSEGINMSPLLKSTVLFIVLTILQVIVTYLQTDNSPTLGEAIKTIVISLIGMGLFWTKSGRLPSFQEVQESLIKGGIEIKNDDPRDPIKLVVNGDTIPKNTIISAISEPSTLPKRA